MPTQAERRRATRDRLVDAGADVLVAEGTAGFTTSAVLERSGLSNGALYRHYPNRLELLVASVERLMARMRQTFADRFVAVGPEATIPDALGALWSCVDSDELLAITEVGALTRTDPELKVLLAPVLAEHHRQIGWLIALVKPTGMDDDTAETIGFFLLYALAGLSADLRAGVDRARVEEFIVMGSRLVADHQPQE